MQHGQTLTARHSARNSSPNRLPSAADVPHLQPRVPGGIKAFAGLPASLLHDDPVAVPLLPAVPSALLSAISWFRAAAHGAPSTSMAYTL